MCGIEYSSSKNLSISKQEIPIIGTFIDILKPAIKAIPILREVYDPGPVKTIKYLIKFNIK